MNTPKMPEMLFDAYMSGMLKFSTPLSTLQFLDSAGNIVGEIYSQLGKMGSSVTDPNFPRDLAGAIAFQARIGLATVMYILGGIDKNELLNSIDDLTTFVNDALKEMPKEARSDFEGIISKLTVTVEDLITKRELLLKYEKETQAKKDSGMSRDEIVESENKQLEAFMQHLCDTDDATKDPDLKAGEAKEEVVQDTQYGSVRKVTIRLPFPFETKVTDGNVIGTVAGYFPNQLRNGSNSSTQVIVKVESASGEFERYTQNPNEQIAAIEPYDPSAQYLLTTVGALKNHNLYS